jgi:hypothetical protein
MTFADLYVIEHSDWVPDPVTRKPLKLFWSNDQGWVGPDCPDVLVLHETERQEFGRIYGLPIAGEFLRLDKWLQSLKLTP